MVYINDTPFLEEPGSCGTCPFLISGSSSLCPQDRGLCSLFNEMHHTWANPPGRCVKLFRRAFKYPEGSRLVIVRH